MYFGTSLGGTMGSRYTLCHVGHPPTSVIPNMVSLNTKEKHIHSLLHGFRLGESTHKQLFSAHLYHFKNPFLGGHGYLEP